MLAILRGMVGNWAARLFGLLFCGAVRPNTRKFCLFGDHFCEQLRIELDKIPELKGWHPAIDADPISIAVWSVNTARGKGPVESAKRVQFTLHQTFQVFQAHQSSLRRLQTNSADTLRDIFGNPWQRVSARAVNHFLQSQKLAESIDAEVQFDRLYELADLLEEEGCEDSTIPDHCRQTEEHVHGCWVIDLILRRK